MLRLLKLRDDATLLAYGRVGPVGTTAARWRLGRPNRGGGMGPRGRKVAQPILEQLELCLPPNLWPMMFPGDLAGLVETFRGAIAEARPSADLRHRFQSQAARRDGGTAGPGGAERPRALPAGARAGSGRSPADQLRGTALTGARMKLTSWDELTSSGAQPRGMPASDDAWGLGVPTAANGPGGGALGGGMAASVMLASSLSQVGPPPAATATANASPPSGGTLPLMLDAVAAGAPRAASSGGAGFGGSVASGAAAQSTSASTAGIAPAVATHVPLTFEPVTLPGDSRTLFRFVGLDDTDLVAPNGVTTGLPPADGAVSVSADAGTAASDPLQITFVGANPLAPGTGSDSLVSGGNSNLESYLAVQYQNVYPGVGLDYYPSDRDLEYDFTVAPGASASKIELSVPSGTQPSLDAGGDLVLQTSAGPVMQSPPTAYQDTVAGRESVAASYVVGPDNSVRFALGSYDPTLPLVIDPLPGAQTPDPANPLGPFAVASSGTGAAATATIDAKGFLTGVTITAGGSGYEVPPTVQFINGNGSGGAAFATVSGGRVTGITVTSAGSYTGPPTVIISTDNPEGYDILEGSGATGTATINASGKVTGITVGAGGSGYVFAPTVLLTGGGGTGGGTATATIAGGVVTGFTVTNPGSYIGPPEVTIVGDQVFKTNLASPVELAASVRRPVNLSGGPFPLIVFLHGNHVTSTNGTNALTQWPLTGNQTAIPSYLGYEYIAKVLASYGDIVISISSNGINGQNQGADQGTLARAELIHEHLDLWNAFNTGQTTITSTAGMAASATPLPIPAAVVALGALFKGKVNMNDVGLMGHSRGGEGVVDEVRYNEGLESVHPETRYGIQAIVALAPTDFNRYTETDVPMAVVLPYLDGDVSDLAGVHYFDDITPGGVAYDPTKDVAPRDAIVVMGANHNFFNTVWTPGNGYPAVDDWARTGIPSPAAPFNQLTAAQEMGVGLAYVTGYFRVYVNGDSRFLPMFTGDAAPPASAMTKNIFVTYSPPLSQRLDVNRLDSTANGTGPAPNPTNNLGGAVSVTVGVAPYTMFGGKDPGEAGNRFVITPQAPTATFLTTPPTMGPLNPNTTRQPQQPDSTPSANVPAKLGLSELSLGWDSNTATYTNNLAAGGAPRDVSSFQNLDFRAGVNFASPLNPTGVPQDFDVILTDANGQTAKARVSAWSASLYYPPGDPTKQAPQRGRTSTGTVFTFKLALLPKLLLNDVRIPLSAFTMTNPKLDLTKVVSVEFAFDVNNVPPSGPANSNGSLVFSEIAFDNQKPAQQVPANQITVTRGGFAKNPKTGIFFQVVTVTNTSNAALSGPISLVLDDLSPNATLTNKTGITQATVPVGSSYITIVPAGETLAAGAKISTTLDFMNSNPALGITYGTRVLAGPGAP